ncbi:hypothetical protein D3C77_681580 [compost metagenome]
MADDNRRHHQRAGVGTGDDRQINAAGQHGNAHSERQHAEDRQLRGDRLEVADAEETRSEQPGKQQRHGDDDRALQADDPIVRDQAG